MTGSTPPPPNGHPVPPRPDPLDMSPGEKVAAEWEARHDVSARGSHANPAAVQEYLRHSRSEEHRHPAQPAHPAGEPAPQPPQPPQAAQPARKPSWLHRLLHRRGS